MFARLPCHIYSNLFRRRCWRRALVSLVGGAWAALLLAGTASAQYRFDSWTTQQGLPQNSVPAIAQTSDGYLWLATYNGLVRFDGVRFTVFDKNNTPAFKTSRFHDLFKDATGALWVNVEEGGVIRYQNGVFTPLTAEQGLPSNTVMNLQSAPDGALLISTTAGAVWWRDGRIVPYEWSAPHEAVKVYLGPSGTHWATDKNGLHARDKGGRATHYALPVGPKFLVNSKMLEDRSGALWVAPPRYGLFKVKDGVVTDYARRLRLPSPTDIFGFLEDRDGSLWFATISYGLIHFSNDAAETLTTYTTADGLSSNGVRGLFRDREGMLWIGTDGGGLNRMTRQFISGYSEEHGLAGNVAHTVLADRAGNVWVGTQKGLSRITGGAITNYQFGDPGSLPLRGPQALHEDGRGRLWIGGYDGLCSFKDGVFSPAVREFNGRGVNVWAIHEDRQGTLWVGTHFGLIKFKDGAPLKAYTTKDGLPKDTVRAIHEDRQGALWLGTEGGLVKYQGGRFTVYTTKDGLVNDRVWSIHEDVEGVLWLGTFDGGLSRFKDGRFANYTTAQGLYNNGVFQILEDGGGNLWMSCYRGLYRVGKQQLNAYADGKISTITSTAFGTADGMLSSDCNGGRQPSGVKTPDGRLWFTTLRGVAVVNPEDITNNPLLPPVLIESAALDNVPVNIGAGIAANTPASLRIAPGQSNLEIGYTAPSFIKAEQVRFKYKLIGQDGDWIEAGTRRTANYSYLRPGQYTFCVIAANSDGAWNQAGAQLRVVVLPAYYQTWWFRALAVLTPLGLAFAAYRWRVRQLRREQQRQVAFSRRLIEAHEGERGRLAAELHDSLGQDLLIIKNWAMVGLTTIEESHSAREMLTEIAHATSHAIENCREVSHNLRPHQLDFIGLTEALRAMVNKVANASGLRIEARLDDLAGALPGEAEINLYRIVQESLNNVVKHARASRVRLDVRKEISADHGRASRTIVKIEDDGQGFDPAGLSNGKRGLGLSSITERTRMLGGEVVIDSAPGGGTTVTVMIDSP